MTKRAFPITPALILLILLTGSGAAFEYHMPVNIQAATTPSVLMPGDGALLRIDLANGAASYGAGGESIAGSRAEGTLLSTPLNRTLLKGTDEIEILTDDYHDLGMMGPDDQITVYYKIRAGEGISSGTYLLNFEVIGGYGMTTICRQIPVKVDSSAPRLAQAEVPMTPSISLNVANPRENTLNAVTIVPSAGGVRFSPEEYYIGTMDPDEVFTISLGVTSDDPQAASKGPMNLSFISDFRNGDNWHQSEAYVMKYSPPAEASQKGSLVLPAGIGATLIIAAGAYIYRRRKGSARVKNKQGSS